MHLLPTIATVALATQAIASPDFEVNPNDEIRLQPEKTEGIHFHHQIPEKGQRHPYENEDIKMDGWRRGFSELKESKHPPLNTFEKRKGGGGGFGGGRSSGGGGRSFGSSISSGGKIGGFFRGSGRSGGSSASSGSRSSGASSTYSGSRSGGGISNLGAGAAAGVAIGYMAGNHHHSSSSQTKSIPPCPQDCRCDSMNTNRLYFTVPPSLSNDKNTTISIKTNWHLSYDQKLKTRLQKEAGLVSIPDPKEKCGWHVMQNIRKNAVHRGLVEFHIPTAPTTNKSVTPTTTTTTTNTPTTTPLKSLPPPLQTKISSILKSTYPTQEISLILSFTLSIFFLAIFCCCRGITRCKTVFKKRSNRRGKSDLPMSVPVQRGGEDGVGWYGQPQRAARVDSFPYGKE
ncbi:hypothetical protein E6O75_ATG04404 [Venturia nashicola]|uniref:Gb n=1 Tax=Venturia nashicola TaxID=86259 RepID=A0A4Z1PD23_9PEZI|nr:hypothetical protein E6O75_ATG04404 [Venturia nashicola]